MDKVWTIPYRCRLTVDRVLKVTAPTLDEAKLILLKGGGEKETTKVVDEEIIKVYHDSITMLREPVFD